MDRRQINGPTGLSNDKRPSLMIDRGSETSLSPSLGDRRSNFMDRRASIGQHQPQHQHKGSIGDSQSTLSGRRSSLSPSSAFITGVELSGSSNQLNTSCEQLEESLHTSSHEQLLTDKFKGNAFFRIARLIGLSSHLLKYLGSVLKNPIEWGWEYDYFYTNMHMLTRGGEYSSTRTKQFAGSLIPQIRIILQKRPRERTELDISTVQQWAAPMKAFRKYTPELQVNISSPSFGIIGCKYLKFYCVIK